MITHKLTEVQDVDQILIIADGQVIAQGTHDELLQSCELYQQKWLAYTNPDSASNTESPEPISPSSTHAMLAALSVGGSISVKTHNEMKRPEPQVTTDDKKSMNPEQSLSDTDIDEVGYTLRAI